MHQCYNEVWLLERNRSTDPRGLVGPVSRKGSPQDESHVHSYSTPGANASHQTQVRLELAHGSTLNTNQTAKQCVSANCEAKQVNTSCFGPSLTKKLPLKRIKNSHLSLSKHISIMSGHRIHTKQAYIIIGSIHLATRATQTLICFLVLSRLEVPGMRVCLSRLECVGNAERTHDTLTATAFRPRKSYTDSHSI